MISLPELAFIFSDDMDESGRQRSAVDDVREEDGETDVELSSNELVIMSPGSTLLSFPVSVG